MSYRTEQEAFWAGEFGNEYIERNVSEQLLASNLSLFSRALTQTNGLSSCIEFGANVGMNLRALKLLYPAQEQAAVEINASAVEVLRKTLAPDSVFHASLLDYVPSRQYDLVLIKGVLIHIDPAHLTRVYDALYQATERYLLVCEYYNPSPVTIEYRGHADRLFKRDFCGELMQRFPELRLVDYGFVYRRDPSFPLDDVTWFLMERRG